MKTLSNSRPFFVNDPFFQHCILEQHLSISHLCANLQNRWNTYFCSLLVYLIIFVANANLYSSLLETKGRFYQNLNYENIVKDRCQDWLIVTLSGRSWSKNKIKTNYKRKTIYCFVLLLRSSSRSLNSLWHNLSVGGGEMQLFLMTWNCNFFYTLSLYKHYNLF